MLVIVCLHIGIHDFQGLRVSEPCGCEGLSAEWRAFGASLLPREGVRSYKVHAAFKV